MPCWVDVGGTNWVGTWEGEMDTKLVNNGKDFVIRNKNLPCCLLVLCTVTFFYPKLQIMCKSNPISC
jgi:hypothetical protein